MNYTLSITEAAEDDIRLAFLWYQEQRSQLGTAFERSVSKAVSSIQDNPLKHQIRYGVTRVFFLSKFPYGIHFNVHEKDILIVAVFHTSQNPEKWEKR